VPPLRSTTCFPCYQMRLNWRHFKLLWHLHRSGFIGIYVCILLVFGKIFLYRVTFSLINHVLTLTEDCNYSGKQTLNFVVFYSVDTSKSFQWRRCSAAPVWHDTQSISAVWSVHGQARKLLQRVSSHQSYYVIVFCRLVSMGRARWRMIDLCVRITGTTDSTALLGCK